MRKVLLCFPILFIMALFWLYEYKPSFPNVPVIYIAHGGGNLGNELLHASPKSFENSIKNNINYIEFDLQIVGDSLFAFHDSISLMKKIKKDSLYSPLTSNQIDSLFVAYPNTFFVTDRISDPKILENHFENLKERMLVESFSFDDYMELKRKKYHEPLISFAMPKSELLRVLWEERANDEKTLVVSNEGFERFKIFFNALYLISPYKLALFAEKTKQMADSLAATDPRVKYVYINKVD